MVAIIRTVRNQCRKERGSQSKDIIWLCEEASSGLTPTDPLYCPEQTKKTRSMVARGWEEEGAKLDECMTTGALSETLAKA